MLFSYFWLMQNFNEFSSFQHNCTINLKGFLMDFSTPKIMGVLNITDDSFYNKSRFNKEHDILKQVENYINNGVDIIDIGAFSSRPGAQLISEEEEMTKTLASCQVNC